MMTKKKKIKNFNIFFLWIVLFDFPHVNYIVLNAGYIQSVFRHHHFLLLLFLYIILYEIYTVKT